MVRLEEVMGVQVESMEEVLRQEDRMMVVD